MVLVTAVPGIPEALPGAIILCLVTGVVQEKLNENFRI